jgi:hypothetical protein
MAWEAKSIISVASSWSRGPCSMMIKEWRAPSRMVVSWNTVKARRISRFWNLRSNWLRT